MKNRGGGRGKECEFIGVKQAFFGEHTNLWTSTVAGFTSLSDPITTDWVPYSHGGLVGETATKVVGGQPDVEVRSATTAPLGGRRTPIDGRHDTPL